MMRNMDKENYSFGDLVGWSGIEKQYENISEEERRFLLSS